MNHAAGPSPHALDRNREGSIPAITKAMRLQAGTHSRLGLVGIQDTGFSSNVFGSRAGKNLVPGSDVLSDGLACFRLVTTAGCSHEAIITSGKHPNDLPQFDWIKTLLVNLKTSTSGNFHAYNSDQYARRHLGGFCSHFNRCF